MPQREREDAGGAGGRHQDGPAILHRHKRGTDRDTDNRHDAERRADSNRGLSSFAPGPLSAGAKQHQQRLMREKRSDKTGGEREARHGEMTGSD